MLQKCLFIFLFILINQTLIHSQTTIKKNKENWELLVDGQPYEIKGVTFGYDQELEDYDTYFKDLNFLGVNTIRTWATDTENSALLDAAHKYGIKVMVGIWMRHGRPGMEDDDRFNYLEDIKGKEAMYANALKIVATYKNHPAVLTWGIGNEVYLNTATDEEKMAYSLLLERICSAIKKEDPNHPITSVEAWTFGLDWWQKQVPSIDIYGLNCYGPGANLLADELAKKDIDKPYLITEFGVTGEWDIKQEINGVKVEPNDKQKYEAISNGYKNWISNKPANLGVFVFHYSSGKNFMAPWLFTHFETYTRPQYWAIRKAFTGKNALNNPPEIKRFFLEDSLAKSGKWLPVNLEIQDQEEDSLSISFSYNQRTGSRIRKDQILPLEYRGDLQSGFEILLPKEDGPVKIYALVKDSYSNIGIASTGIRVSDEIARNRKFLVPKVALPFYVYKDGKNDPFSASAFMGNHKAMQVETKQEKEVFAGNAALRIFYDQDYDWYGLGLVNPANDWGDILGGYDISGAKRFSFWAKTDQEELIATVGFGLIAKDKPFPDSAKKSIQIKLTKNWKKYSFSTKKLDLSCIRSGFTIFSSSYGFSQNIYIDEVVFE